MWGWWFNNLIHNNEIRDNTNLAATMNLDFYHSNSNNENTTMLLLQVIVVNSRLTKIYYSSALEVVDKFWGFLVNLFCSTVSSYYELLTVNCDYFSLIYLS